MSEACAPAITRAGFPGTIRTMTNVARTTPNITAIVLTSRRAANRNHGLSMKEPRAGAAAATSLAATAPGPLPEERAFVTAPSTYPTVSVKGSTDTPKDGV